MRLVKASNVLGMGLIARWQLILKASIVLYLILEIVSSFFILLDLGLIDGTLLLDFSHQDLDLLLLFVGDLMLLESTLALATNRV